MWSLLGITSKAGHLGQWLGKEREGAYIKVASESNQIIWTQQSSDPQVYCIDTATALGAFTRENLDALTTLNKELDRKKEEVKKLEE